MKPEALRQNITIFISKQLKSQQETVALVENYTDQVLLKIDYIDKCKPLHLKTNFTKEFFTNHMNLVLVEAKISPSVNCFKDIHLRNTFHKFTHFVKHDMNSNYFPKKVVVWFNENKQIKKKGIFDFASGKKKVIIICRTSKMQFLC